MEILQHVYLHLETLEQFLQHIPFQRGTDCCLSDKNHDKYKALVTKIYVCCNNENQIYPDKVQYVKNWTQHDLLVRLIIKLSREKTDNMLTRCHTQISDDLNTEQLKHVKLNSANSCTSELLNSSWETLLECIGEEVMEFLLEKKSLFVMIPGNNFIQLTGRPVYREYRFSRSYISIKPVPDNISYTKVKARKKILNGVMVSSAEIDYKTTLGRCTADENRQKNKLLYIKEESVMQQRWPDHSNIEFREEGETVKRMETGRHLSLESEAMNKSCKRKLCEREESLPAKRVRLEDCEARVSMNSAEESFCRQRTLTNDRFGDSKHVAKQSSSEVDIDMECIAKKSCDQPCNDFNYIHSFNTDSKTCSLEFAIEHEMKNKMQVDKEDDESPGSEPSRQSADDSNQSFHTAPNYSNSFEYGSCSKHSSLYQAGNMSINDASAYLVNNACVKEPSNMYLMNNACVKEPSNMYLNIPAYVNRTRKKQRGRKKKKRISMCQPWCGLAQHFTEPVRHRSSNMMLSGCVSSTSNVKLNGGSVNGSSNIKSSEGCVNGSSDIKSSDGCLNGSLNIISSDVFVKVSPSNIKLRYLCGKYSSSTNDIGLRSSYNIKASDVCVNCSSNIKLSDVCLKHSSSTSDVGLSNPKSLNKSVKRRRRQKKKNAAMIRPCLRKSYEHSILLKIRKMFFTKLTSVKFPPLYILPKLKNDEKSVAKVLQQIDRTLVLFDSNSATVTNEAGVLNPQLKPLIAAMLRRHWVCRYRYLLKHHTTAAAIPQIAGVNDQDIVLSKCIEKRKVYLFIRACLAAVVPKELFGHVHNRNVFYRNVQRFIGMGLHDQYSLGELMFGIKPRGIWKIPGVDHSICLHLLAKWLLWLMGGYVSMLVKSLFYVTNSTSHGNTMFYFKIQHWNKFHAKAVEEFIQTQSLKPLDAARAKSLISSQKSLGFAMVRFLPKTDSKMRPIFNLSQKQRIGSVTKSSINWQLRDAMKLVKSRVKEIPAMIGSAKNSLDEIQSALLEFKSKLGPSGCMKPLYAVKVDVKDCFGSINTSILSNIVNRCLKDLSSYIMRSYYCIQITEGRLKKEYRQPVVCAENYVSKFSHFCNSMALKKKVWNSVLIDECRKCDMDIARALGRISSLLFSTIIHIGRQYYLMGSGIPQGSTISTVLCDIYHGELERDFLGWIGADELLMRHVDDYILITPYKENAVRFLREMNTGNVLYNCYISPQKTIANFTCDDLVTTALSVTDLMPWNGLLIDLSTLDIRIDYSVYAGTSVSSFVSLNSAQSPGEALISRLVYSMRCRCHALFFDGRLNSDEVVLENILNVIVLHAYKFHYSVRHLPVKQSWLKCARFLYRVVWRCAQFMWNRLRQAGYPRGIINRETAQWFFINGFILKLNQHRAMYRRVIGLLKQRSDILKRSLNYSAVSTFNMLTVNGIPRQFATIIG